MAHLSRPIHAAQTKTPIPFPVDRLVDGPDEPF
jgi:hypothetical protein